MKKVLIAVCFLGLAVSTTAAPLLVESYQEEQIYIPGGETDTVTVAEVGFSVDTSCYVQFATGGRSVFSKVWLEVDGEKLPPLLIAPGTYDFINITYTYLFSPGDYIISLQLFGSIDQYEYCLCEDGYLQALIFLPDAGGAIAERPADDADATGEMTSVISRGPYVTVTGASELVDASGRVIEGAIVEDRVSINALPQGTYFARDGERTVVKIVKVQ